MANDQQPFDDFKYLINEDRTAVTLSSTGSTFNAQQLDELIQSLAMMRASMQPGHPEMMPPLNEWVYYPIDGWFALPRKEAKGTPAEEGFMMALRSPGIGWSQAEFPPEHAQQLLAFLNSKRPDNA